MQIITIWDTFLFHLTDRKSDMTVSNFGEGVRLDRAYPVHLLVGGRWRQVGRICCGWTHPCLGQVIHIRVCILEEVLPTNTRMLVQDRGSSCVGDSSHWELICISISWTVDRLWTVNMLGHISENMLEMNKSTWKTSHCGMGDYIQYAAADTCQVLYIFCTSLWKCMAVFHIRWW